MSDRNKALEAFGRIYSESYTQDDWWIVEDALNRFSNLTSPETIEKGAKAADEVLLDSGYPVHKKWSDREVRAVAEAVLRSVEEGPMSRLDPPRLSSRHAEANCEGCRDFYAEGDIRKVRGAAKKHVDETGHTATIDAFSFQYVRPSVEEGKT